MNGRKYEECDCMSLRMVASVIQNGRLRTAFLSVIMVLMTQVAYADTMDFSIGLDQETESKDTGRSTHDLSEDLDDDNDGISNSEEEAGGTDPTNPDTDGDGICDGPATVDPDCVAGPDVFPLDPSADTDTDGDGDPDTVTGNSTSIPALVEDIDDDDDGIEDVNETGTLTYNGPTDPGTDPLNPDTDGDGFCDGPADVYAADGTLVCKGPDPEPLDSALPVDTDGDMFPDEDPDGPGGLEADTDDDGDGFSDKLENNCASDSLDANIAPADLDGDNICDIMDADIDGDGLKNIVETNTGIYISPQDSGSDPLNADTDEDGYCDGPVSPNYSECIAVTDAFPTDASAHLDTDEDGNPDAITGNSTTGLLEDLDDDNDGASDLAEADCGTDPLNASETPKTDSDGNCLLRGASSESLLDWNWGWGFCLILLLLLLLLTPIAMAKGRTMLMLADSPEPDNTTRKN